MRITFKISSLTDVIWDFHHHLLLRATTQCVKKKKQSWDGSPSMGGQVGPSAFYNAAFAYPSVFSPLCLFKCVSTGQMCFQMCLFKYVSSNVSSLGSTGQVCPSAFYKPPFFPAFLPSKATPFCSSVILKVWLCWRSNTATSALCSYLLLFFFF